MLVCMDCGVSKGSLHLTTCRAFQTCTIEYGTAFDRARKQEIDAMRDTHTATVTAVDCNAGTVTYTLASLDDIVNFERGTCVAIPAYPTDGPESYDDLLEEIEGDGGVSMYDFERTRVAREAGDQKLAELLKQQQDLELLICEHARAMQAARKLTPLVQPNPLKGLAAWLPDTTPMLMHWSGTEWLKENPITETRATQRSPVTERTCSTCSKTCDVGQKCWWCGNA